MSPSRQYAWQLKKMSLGLCATCGKNKIQKMGLCNNCRKKKLQYNHEWAQRNPAYTKEMMRLWREKNPEYQKEYYQRRKLMRQK